MKSCILCGNLVNGTFYEGEYYRYLHCDNCDLVFAEPGERLPPEEEQQRYELHENDPDDPGYREFLGRLLNPLTEQLQQGARGLDYGSGPGPTLSIMFEEHGFPMEIYDPFYADRPNVLRQKYDFITCTETAEHFYAPDVEFERLWSMLKPGGLLGLMTLLRPDNQPFCDWYYHREDTHVTFYSRKTFQWLAGELGASLQIIDKRIIILKKRRGE